LNSAGIGLLAKINNLGVFSEILGAALLILLLAAHAVRGPEVVFETHARGDGQALGYLGPFLAAAALTASYVMYGFDTAGALAEETHDPRRTAPWAILQALTSAAAAGALLMLFGMMAAQDIRDPMLLRDDGGLPYIVNQSLGKGLGTLFLCDVVFAITVCALAVHAGTVRLIFAMARDNNLPFSRSLARVSQIARTPVWPAVVTGVLAVVVLGVNVDFPNVIEIVTSVAVLWANLAYLFVTGLLLRQRLRGWPADAACGFALGKWGLPVNLLAVGWGLIAVVNIGWPRPPAGDGVWYQRYAALFCTGVLLFSGVAYYGLVQRHKTGVLEEHRARI
jgi:amino acid transporter